MIALLAIHHPKPDHVDDLLGAMAGFAPALEQVDGVIRVEAWREVGGGRIFAMSVWESEAAVGAAMPRMAELLADVPFDEWEQAPYEMVSLAPHDA
jgi:quinol monooxygenase YgiN